MKNEQEKINSNFQASMSFAKKIAEKNGFKLNPNETQLHRLCNHLADNKENHGRLFCPCKQHYPIQPDIDPICPCPTFKKEIKEQGHCECHLFFSPEAELKMKSRPGLLANVACPG